MPTSRDIYQKFLTLRDSELWQRLKEEDQANITNLTKNLHAKILEEESKAPIITPYDQQTPVEYEEVTPLTTLKNTAKSVGRIPSAIVSTGATGAGAVLDFFGADNAAKTLYDTANQVDKQAQEFLPDTFKPIEGIKEFKNALNSPTDFLQLGGKLLPQAFEVVGSSLPLTFPGGVAAKLAGFLGKSQKAINAARLAGLGFGSGATSLGGMQRAEYNQTGEIGDDKSKIPYALGVAALDFLPGSMEQGLSKWLSGQAGQEAVKRGVLGTGWDMLKSGATEFVQEGAQSGFEGSEQFKDQGFLQSLVSGFSDPKVQGQMLTEGLAAAGLNAGGSLMSRLRSPAATPPNLNTNPETGKEALDTFGQIADMTPEQYEEFLRKKREEAAMEDDQIPETATFEVVPQNRLPQSTEEEIEQVKKKYQEFQTRRESPEITPFHLTGGAILPTSEQLDETLMRGMASAEQKQRNDIKEFLGIIDGLQKQNTPESLAEADGYTNELFNTYDPFYVESEMNRFFAGQKTQAQQQPQQPKPQTQQPQQTQQQQAQPLQDEEIWNQAPRAATIFEAASAGDRGALNDWNQIPWEVQIAGKHFLEAEKAGKQPDRNFIQKTIGQVKAGKEPAIMPPPQQAPTEVTNNDQRVRWAIGVLRKIADDPTSAEISSMQQRLAQLDPAVMNKARELYQAELQAGRAQPEVQIANPKRPKTSPKSYVNTEGVTGLRGKPTKIRTPRGQEVEGEFRIIEADQGRNSFHDGYSVHLQDRDTDKGTSREQIERIRDEVIPSDLVTDFEGADVGAPIYGINDQDGQLEVEIGNHRDQGIREGYAFSNYNTYRDYLMQNAAALGFNPEDIKKMYAPKLIRVRTTQLDPDSRTSFANSGNTPRSMAKSAAEIALTDAKYLGPVLDQIHVSEDGEINTASNRDFFRQFLGQVSTPQEQNRLVTRDGKALTQEGLNRVKNAIFASAYPNNSLVERLADSTDERIKRVLNGMIKAASDTAQTKNLISRGQLHDIQISDDLAKAADKLAELRETETTVDEYLAQGRIFDDGMTPESKLLLAVADRAKNANVISDIMTSFNAQVKAIGDPHQGNLFGDVPLPSKESILDFIIQRDHPEIFAKKDAIANGAAVLEKAQPEAEKPSGLAKVAGIAREIVEGKQPQQPEAGRGFKAFQALRAQNVAGAQAVKAANKAGVRLEPTEADSPIFSRKTSGGPQTPSLFDWLSAREQKVPPEAKQEIPAQTVQPAQTAQTQPTYAGQVRQAVLDLAGKKEGGGQINQPANDYRVDSVNGIFIVRKPDGTAVKDFMTTIKANAEAKAEALSKETVQKVTQENPNVSFKPESNINDQATVKQPNPQVKEETETNEAKPEETIKQPATKSFYTVKPSNGGFAIIDPEGKQFSWGTNREAIENRVAELNKPASEAPKTEQPESGISKVAKAAKEAIEGKKAEPAEKKESGISKVVAAAKKAIEGKNQTPPQPGKIEDFGEKIGGARKDTAAPTGKRASYDLKPVISNANELDENGDQVTNDPAWKKRFIPMQQVQSKDWVLFDKIAKRAVRKGWEIHTFKTEKEAEEMIPIAAVSLKHRVSQANSEGTNFKIIREVTDRKRVTIKDGFKSDAEAKAYLVRNAVEILETKTGFGEEILPRPEKVFRSGAERRKGDVKPEDFSIFGFRGVEFGNWNNQDERQEVMNHAYDGLLDLADILKVPARALSLNGELALAFGARGQGLSGARAHYESDYGVINLTKMKGAGSLAHEWFHALDHYFARQDGKASSEKETNKLGDQVFKVDKSRSGRFVSFGFGYRTKVRPELKKAYNNIIETMLHKAENFVHDTKRAENAVGGARNSVEEKLKQIRTELARDLTHYKKRFGAPATPEQLTAFDVLAEKIMSGEALETRWQHNEKSQFNGRTTNDTIEEINKIMKTVRNRSGFNAERQGPLNYLVARIRHYKDMLELFDKATRGDVQTKKVITSYNRESQTIDMGRTNDYWSQPHEMASRAFSAYVEDKITEAGNKSDFLSYGSDNNLPAFRLLNVRPFPEGDERKAINNAFDEFVDVLKTKETEKGVALYSRKSGKSETENFRHKLVELAKNDYYASKSLVVCQTPQVLKELGAESLPVTIHPETVYKAIIGKHNLDIDSLAQLPKALDEPIMVFDSKTVPGDFVVMTEIVDKKGKTVVAAIHLSGKESRHKINLIASVYGKDNEKTFIDWLKSGLGRYVDMKKASAWAQSRGLYLPKEEQLRSTQLRSSNKIIIKKDGKVKFSEKASKKLVELERIIADETEDNRFIGAFQAVPAETLTDGEMISQLMKDVFDKNLVVFKSNHPDGSFFHGTVIPSRDSKTIFIEASTDKPATVVAGHELLHLLKADAPDLYQQLTTDLEGLIKDFPEFKARLEKLSGKAIEDSAAQEELFGDFLGDQMANKAFWGKVARKNPSAFKRISVLIQEMFAKLKNWLTSNDYGSSEFFSDIDAAQNAFSSALADYSRRKISGTKLVADAIKSATGQKTAPSSDNLKKVVGAMKSAYSYAGQKATGFKKAEEEGRTFEGPYDGKTRFEIDDSKAHWKIPSDAMMMDESNPDQAVILEKLGTIFQHDKLFKNYPQLKEVPIKIIINPTLKPVGSFSPKSGDIAMIAPDLEEARRTLMHELQHSLQEIENFAKGGSPQEFVRERRAQIEKLEEKVGELNAKLSKAVGTPAYNDLMDKRSEIVDQIRKLEGNSYVGVLEAGFNDYKALAGEIEARDVEDRIDLTEDERAEYEPFGSAEIAPEDSIVRYSRKLRDIEFADEEISPKLINVKGSNSEITIEAAKEFESWPETIEAADGTIVLLRNKQGDRLSTRLKHLVWNNTTNRLNKGKAEWLPNVPETLRGAAVRLIDSETENRVYVRSYAGKQKHMVVVRADGTVENQSMISAKLITQFPYSDKNRRENMEVEWFDPAKIREDHSERIGRSSGNPNLTPGTDNDPELSAPRNSSVRSSINKDSSNDKKVKFSLKNLAAIAANPDEVTDDDPTLLQQAKHFVTHGLVHLTSEVAEMDPAFKEALRRNPEARTAEELFRTLKVTTGNESRAAEDQVLAAHIRADNSKLIDLVLKYTQPGAFRDWMLKKVRRIVAPVHEAQNIQKVLFMIGERIYWNGSEMVASPGFRTRDENGQYTYTFENSLVDGQAALKAFRELPAELQQILTDRAKKNEQYRQEFVTKWIPRQKANVGMAAMARLLKQIAAGEEDAPRNQATWSKLTKEIDKNLTELASKITSAKGQAGIARMRERFDFLKNRFGQDNSGILGSLDEIPMSERSIGSLMMEYNGIDRNSGHYGYVHHAFESKVSKTLSPGSGFDASEKFDHPWFEAVSDTNRIREGAQGHVGSLMKADIAQRVKEIKADKRNEWMSAIEDEYGITPESVTDEKGNLNLPDGYDNKSWVMANFGRQAGKKLFIPSNIFALYKQTLERGTVDPELKEISGLLDQANQAIGLINEAMLYHPAKFARDLYSAPFHIAEFIMDWTIKNPEDWSDVWKGLWKGIKSAVSPKEWQRLNPESFGEYSESLAYQDRKKDSILTRALNAMSGNKQAGSVMAALLRQINLAGAADLPIKRIMRVTGETLADKRGLKGQERERFIYKVLNQYAFDTSDLPGFVSFIRGGRPDSTSKVLGAASRATIPFMGYATRLARQVLVTPLTHGVLSQGERTDWKYRLAEIRRPIVWAAAIMFIRAGGLGNPPEEEEAAGGLKNKRDLDYAARTATRILIKRDDNKDGGEYYMATKGYGHLSLADSILGAIRGKQSFGDVVQELGNLHPVTKTALSLFGMEDPYSKQVPLSAKLGRMAAMLALPQFTRMGPEAERTFRLIMKDGALPDQDRDNFFTAFVSQLGIPVTEAKYRNGKILTTKAWIEAARMAGFNIRFIPYELVEGEVQKELVSVKKVYDQIKAIREGKAQPWLGKTNKDGKPMTEQQWLFSKGLFGKGRTKEEALETMEKDYTERTSGLKQTIDVLEKKGFQFDEVDKGKAFKQSASADDYVKKVQEALKNLHKPKPDDVYKRILNSR